MVYQSDPDRLPDTAFLEASLDLVAAGNEGRFLDARRTPFRIDAVDLDSGTFRARITAFEDAGAVWELGLESWEGCQFSPESTRVSASVADVYRERIERFDRVTTIETDPAARDATSLRIRERREEAGRFLDAESSFLASGTAPGWTRSDTHPGLWDDWSRFLGGYGLQEMERLFAERFVRNPYSGDLVKGHRVVLAELGLVPYRGKVIRDPAIFEGPWSRERRTEHILCRLAFLRELFTRLGCAQVVLHRGLSWTGELEPPRNESFVSYSFDPEVARSHFQGPDPDRDGILLRRTFPVDRLFMTFLETAEMNRHYREGEAVLLFDPEDTAV